MHDAAERLTALDSIASHWIRIVGVGIESFGVLVIVAGIAWSTYHATHQRADQALYRAKRAGRNRVVADAA